SALIKQKKVPEALRVIDQYEKRHTYKLYSERIELAKISKDAKLTTTLEAAKKDRNKRFSALKKKLDKRVKAIRGASHMDTKTIDHIREGRLELIKALQISPNNGDIRYFRAIIALRASNAFGYILMKSRSFTRSCDFIPNYAHTSFDARAWLSQTGIEEFIEAPAKEFDISDAEKYCCRAFFHIVDSLVDIGENLEFKKSRARKALKEAERCLYFDPRAKTAYLFRGYCHGLLGHPLQAERDFSHFTTKNELISVHYFKALLALNAKQTKDGLKEIKVMVKNGYKKSLLPVNPLTKPLRQTDEYREYLRSK
ncbi:MAG: hypothetical protein P1V97_05320, partial [Planctomycetota bacterium]|nr:hypothetical protein [Planctomycetota bacterium]